MKWYRVFSSGSLFCPNKGHFANILAQISIISSSLSKIDQNLPYILPNILPNIPNIIVEGECFYWIRPIV